MARLGDVCEIISGSTPKTNVPEYWNGDLNWITPAEIDDTVDIVYETVRKITEVAIKSCSLTLLPAGTVILSSRAPIGKVAIAGVPMYCNQGFKNLVCSDAIFNKYLFWYLRCKTDYLNSLGRGATFKEISTQIVRNIEIPLPSMEQQRHIASVLDKVSDVIRLRKQQLAKLDELIKARFVEMFGDPEANPKGWRKEQLKDHASVMVGYPFPSEGYTSEGINIVGGYNLMQGFIQWAESKHWPAEKGYEQYLLQINDIVMAMDRPWVNGGFKIARIDSSHLPAILIQRTACIRGKDIEQEFLYYLLDSSRFAEHCNVTGSLVPHISNKDINSFQVILPPIELQEQFASFVSQVDQSKSAIQKALDETQLLFDSLMQKFFG